MQISLTARHCELTPEVRAFAHQRLEKLQRFARDITEAHLIVTGEKYRHSAEITVKLKHQDMASREVSNDAHAAIDLAATRLEQQLRRLKDRRVDRKRNAGREPVNGADAPPSAGEAEELEGDSLGGYAGEE